MTETKFGLSSSSCAMIWKSASAWSSVLGGKNSKESVVLCLSNISLICIWGAVLGFSYRLIWLHYGAAHKPIGYLILG